MSCKIVTVILALVPLLAGRQEVQSPRLNALLVELQRGNAQAVDDFWHGIAKQGTPLIEQASDRKDYSNVTFLWRGDAGTTNVLVSTLEQREIANGDYMALAKMTRLGETDLWFKTLRLRNDARFTYQLSPNDPLTLLTDIPREDWAGRRARFVPDPLNARRFETRNGASSVAELPSAPAQPWLERLPGVPAGTLHAHAFTSSVLKNQRTITVYTPPGYDTGSSYPLLIFFDGSTYLGPVPGPVILDNFTARKRLPPVVAVFVGNVDGPTRVRELSHNEAFEEFLARELVPWAKRTYRVTSRPSQTAVIGSSIGATAAAFSALRHPELFGNVLSQSGGYQMAQAPRDDFGPRAPGQVFEDDFPEYEWIARQYAAQARTAVKFYLEIGLREEAGWKFVVAPFAQPGAVGAHRHLRDVLRARGYEVHYNEFNGGHDALCWRGSVADGLVALIGTRHGSR